MTHFFACLRWRFPEFNTENAEKSHRDRGGFPGDTRIIEDETFNFSTDLRDPYMSSGLRFSVGLLPVVSALLEHGPVRIGVVAGWRILLIGLILLLLFRPRAQGRLVSGLFLLVQLEPIFNPG